MLAGLLLPASAALEAQAAPAPALTYNQVGYVESTANNSGEQVTDYQQSTRNDHRGPEVLVVTVEYGIADPSTRIATLDGRRPVAVEISNILNGRTVVGHVCYFRFNAANVTNLKFNCTATSANLPPPGKPRTLTDSIVIR